MKVKDEVDFLGSDVVLHFLKKLETNEETPHFIKQPYESTWTEIWSLNQKNISLALYDCSAKMIIQVSVS